MNWHYFNKYIAGIYRLSKNDINHHISALDVRATQSDVLMFISEHPNKQQKQIAEEMAIDPSLLARELRVLAVKGLIERRTDTTERRGNRILLTAAGKEVVDQLIKAMSYWWQDVFSDMPNGDSEKMVDMLSKIYIILQNKH